MSKSFEYKKTKSIQTLEGKRVTLCQQLSQCSPIQLSVPGPVPQIIGIHRCPISLSTGKSKFGLGYYSCRHVAREWFLRPSGVQEWYLANQSTTVNRIRKRQTENHYRPLKIVLDKEKSHICLWALLVHVITFTLPDGTVGTWIEVVSDLSYQLAGQKLTCIQAEIGSRCLNGTGPPLPKNELLIVCSSAR